MHHDVPARYMQEVTVFCEDRRLRDAGTTVVF